MSDLNTKKCEVCRVGADPVTPAQAASLLPQIPHWEIIQVDGIDQLKRTYTFKNFAQALEFTDKVGAIAEEEGHHPVLTTTWGRVTVVWYTHKIKGLHLNDFIMASKSDRLYTQDL